MTTSAAPPEVTVLLPVHRVDEPASLRRAFASMAGQSLASLDILLLANGADERTLALVNELAASDPRARVITLPQANLAAALNEGLGAARSELVARMDADDWSHPDRLRVQVEAMNRQPSLAALGCAWERVDAAGGRERMEVPTDPAELRWRMLLGNPLAHGSMMLRRSLVLEVGGYDPACLRAQDYDLWLRLGARHPIAAVPQVLYEYRVRHAGGREDSVAQQSLTAGRALVNAWSELPACTREQREELASIIGPVIGGDPLSDTTRARAEQILRSHGPSATALLARLWMEWKQAAGRPAVADVCRLARVREVLAQMRAHGAARIILWGAGRHTQWLLEHAAQVSLELGGIVDDAAAGQRRWGIEVQSPRALGAGDWVLISSDGFEAEIWEASREARARGARVWRVYSENSPAG